MSDAAALAKLPADEQKAFTQLWADVAALSLWPNLLHLAWHRTKKFKGA